MAEPIKAASESTECLGQHRYFALDMIIENDFSVTIPLICTQCGGLKLHNLRIKAKEIHKKEK